MKIAVLFVSLCAIAVTKAGPVKKNVVKPPLPTPTAPVSTVPPTTPVIAPAQLVASKYKVSFKLANVKYTDDLSNFDSQPYQTYARRIENALLNLYSEDNAYKEMKVLGFRNESGVIGDVTLRFGNESTNLASLDALVRTGLLGDLPVDPASLTAEKDESLPAMAIGFGCASPCGAPQQCFPSCSSSCCGASSSSFMPPMMGNQQYPAPMPPMGGMQGFPMSGSMMPYPGASTGQCPGQCSSSCAPSCPQSCCGGGQMNPMMG